MPQSGPAFAREAEAGREVIEQALPLSAQAEDWPYESVCHSTPNVIAEVGDEPGLSGLPCWGATCEVIAKTEKAAVHAGQPGFSTGGGHYFYAPLPKRALHYVGVEWYSAAQTKTVFDLSLPFGQGLVANSFSYGYHPLRSVLTMETDTDTVPVRAGTFENCLRVRTVTTEPHPEPDPDEHGKILNKHACGTRVVWYAPGVGLVKIEIHSDDGTEAIEELIAYSVKGDANDYWPLTVGNTWEYAPVGSSPNYQTKCVYTVTEEESERYYVSVARYMLNAWLIHAKRGELEKAGALYPDYLAYEGGDVFRDAGRAARP